MRLLSFVMLCQQGTCSLQGLEEPERRLKVEVLVNPVSPVLEASRELVSSADYVNLVLKMKGLNTDGTLMDKAEYLTYMSTILGVSQAPADWSRDALERFLSTVTDLKITRLDDGVDAVGFAHLYEWLRFKEVLANAIVFAEEIALVSCDKFREYAPKLLHDATAEGSHYSRLAYYTEMYAPLFAMRDESNTYAKVADVLRSGLALNLVWDSEMVTLSASPARYFKDVILDHALRPVSWDAPHLAVFFRTLWAARDISPLKFDLVPTDLMARILVKLTSLMETSQIAKHQSGIGLQLLRGDFDDLLTDIGKMRTYLVSGETRINPNVITVKPIGYPRISRSPKSVADLVSPRG